MCCAWVQARWNTFCHRLKAPRWLLSPYRSRSIKDCSLTMAGWYLCLVVYLSYYSVFDRLNLVSVLLTFLLNFVHTSTTLNRHLKIKCHLQWEASQVHILTFVLSHFVPLSFQLNGLLVILQHCFGHLTHVNSKQEVKMTIRGHTKHWMHCSSGTCNGILSVSFFISLSVNADIAHTISVEVWQ